MPHETPPREVRRIPLETSVRLRFENLREFFTSSSMNLSLGGMFLKTSTPPPPGAVLEIEFTLPDETRLIRALGEVVWARHEDQGAERPAGMGIRFLELDGESRRLIFEVVDQHIQQGGDPFDLERAAQGTPDPSPKPRATAAGEGRKPLEELLPPAFRDKPARGAGGAAAPGGIPTPSPERPAPRAPRYAASIRRPRRRRPRRALVAGASLVVLVAVAGLVTWLSLSDHRSRPSARPAPTAAAPKAAEATSGATAPAAEPPEEPSGDGVPTATPTTAGGSAGSDGNGDGTSPAEHSVETTVAPAPATSPAATATTAATAAGARPIPATAPPGPPLTRIEFISFRRVQHGTEVIITGNAPIVPADFHRFYLGGVRPREVLRIQGIEQPYDGPASPPPTPEVLRVRTGHHVNGDERELHVVLDLASPDVRVVAEETLGRRLLLRLASAPEGG